MFLCFRYYKLLEVYKGMNINALRMTMGVKTLFLNISFVNEYSRFKQSLTNRVSFWQYIKFKFGHSLIYWPVHKNSEVTYPQNIYVGINSNAGTRPGCYLQGNGGIRIGNYVHFASNVGIISANHNPYNQMNHITKEVRIDDYTWIGMNAVILPGVHLGERTIVGAGAVVTRSFPEGYCIIAGNPAKKIKELDKSQFLPQKFPTEFYGYVEKEKFPKFAKVYLSNNRYFADMCKI